jgi:hypothetical protein
MKVGWKRARMPDFDPSIDCPIELFSKQERKIQDLTRRINQATTIQQKAELTRALREQVEVLVKCSAFDEGNIHCGNCQVISGVRSIAATLILAMEALDQTCKV